jgi:hypothetical protein
VSLTTIPEGVSGAAVIANENFVAVEPAATFANKQTASSGLTWAYYGGRIGGTLVADGTVTLSNATNYIVAARSGFAVTTATNTTNWENTAQYIRIAQVVAAGGVVTSQQDRRLGPGGLFSIGSNGTVERWIPARDMSPSASGGCAALATIATSANQPDIQTLDFDATTQEYAQFSMIFPPRWNLGTVTFVPVWSHPATTVNFGVVWDLQAVARSNDEAIAVAYGTAQTSTDTGGTTNDIYMGPESAAITINSTPSAGDLVFFRISRVTGNGSDNMAVDARLHGIRLRYSVNAETDA